MLTTGNQAATHVLPDNLMGADVLQRKETNDIQHVFLKHTIDFHTYFGPAILNSMFKQWLNQILQINS